MCSEESSVLSLSMTTLRSFLFLLLGAPPSRPSIPIPDALPPMMSPDTSMDTSFAPNSSMSSGSIMSLSFPNPSSLNPSFMLPPADILRASRPSAPLSLAPRTISTSLYLLLLEGEPPMPSSSKKFSSPAASGLKASQFSPSWAKESMPLVLAFPSSWVATTQSLLVGRASREKGRAKASPLLSAPSFMRTIPVPFPASTNSPKLATLICAGLVCCLLLFSSMSTAPGRKAILILTRASLQSAMRYLTLREYMRTTPRRR
mmetsp:Transcript_22835/g.47366  ORF Transcript_22835/g.47366 Transcript_22835/m.47366 type:complete len:260 (+) Transcript_22835:893-1672(+)